MPSNHSKLCVVSLTCCIHTTVHKSVRKLHTAINKYINKYFPFSVSSRDQM